LPAFDVARRQSIIGLGLQPGDRVLLVGAGTGLDLPHVPPGVAIVAIDVTPAMLTKLRARAARLGVNVDARAMDARALSFDAGSFDAVVMHLILAVMPQPELGLLEAERVLQPGGRVAVFDKFLRTGETPSLMRRLLNVVASLLFSDINRELASIVARTSLVFERDEPAAFGGMFRVVTLRKPEGGTVHA
jgi:ubiquinone/menaquinone biosynthesis C-methylase UbiE